MYVMGRVILMRLHASSLMYTWALGAWHLGPWAHHISQGMGPLPLPAFLAFTYHIIYTYMLVAN